MASITLTPEQELQAQALASRIREAVDSDIVQLARLLVSKPEHEIFGQTEFEVRDIVHHLGAAAMQTHLGQKKNGYRGCSVVCPHCGQSAEFQDWRTRTPLSLVGAITCCRAWYHCHRCGKGVYPWDEAVGLTAKRLTPAAEQAVSMAGAVCNSFAEAAERVLGTLAGLRICESTVQRTAEDAGARVGQWLAQGRTLGKAQRWDWRRDADGQTCAYISIDATGVRQQAAGGGKADGRMPYVAMVYNPVPELAADSPYQPGPQAVMQARYLAGLYGLDELGLQLRRQAAQVGMDRAQRWIGLTDGGNGLEGFVDKNFPRDIIVILDFWHAADYLTELGKLLEPQDEAARQERVQQWCHIMKHEGGSAIIAELARLPLPARKPAVAAKHAEVLRYFRNNEHRMDYPRYQAHGWLIGSGAVESGCKTVVGQRLKLAGMRWGEDGTDEMCHLRALFKSEANQWEAFWRRQYNQPSSRN